MKYILKTKKLGELTSYMAKGIPPKYADNFSENTIFVLNQKCNRDFKISYEYARFHNTSIKKVPEEKMLKSGDVLINSTGTGTAGRIAQIFNVIKPTTIDGHMILMRPTAEIDSLYYGYALKAHQSAIESLAEGSTGQTEINKKRLSDEIFITYPDDISVQKEIVYILYAYDNIIENNQKQIKLLEEASQRLYKEWFVDLRFPNYENTPVIDGVPKEWKRIPIKDLSALLRRGISPKYNDMAEYNVINKKCIRQTVMNIRESRKQEKSYLDEMNLQDSDIVICSTGAGTLGRVGQVFGEYPDTTFDSHVTLVRAKEEVGKQFLFQSLKYQQPLFMTLGKGSTNQLELSKRTIENYDIIYPTDKIIQAFEFIAQPIYEKITALVSVVKSATEARNRLLPKLINGEILIKEH
ncbi:MAG: restriction endonuclease subunit S [Ruminococcus sp.]|nr:restriction endonuclease subunit S [Ruminococcus sp.]